MPPRGRSFATLAMTLGVLLATAPAQLRAQIPANQTWRTIRTAHFDVEFTPPLEPMARRAAAVAERAYANLASELVPPRGPIDLVISDGADISNGAASVFPRNNIVIFARPPVDAAELRSYGDWTALVIQHELTHIFQLDRTRGWWRIAQDIFGRNPALFPETYQPSWVTEGLAVYYETRFAPAGRLTGAYHAAVAAAAGADRRIPPLDAVSEATSRFPYGTGVYVFGAYLMDQLAARGGPGSVRRYIERSSSDVIPYLLDPDAHRAFGESFSAAWRRWRDSVTASAAVRPAFAASAAGIPLRTIVRGERALAFPRWLGDTTVVFAADNARETPGAYALDISGRDAPRRLGRRNSLGVNDPAPAPAGGSTGPRIVFAQLDYLDRFRLWSDLYETVGGVTRRLTVGARLTAPDVRGDGEIVAVQTAPGTTRLVRVSSDGSTIRALTPGSLSVQWAAPVWAPSGHTIAAIRIANGRNEIVLLGPGAARRVVVRSRAPIRSVAWAPGGNALIYSADEGGVTRISVAAADGRDPVRPGAVLASAVGGLYDVAATRSTGDTIAIAATRLGGDGYALDLWRGTLADTTPRPPGPPPPDAAPWDVTPDESPSRPYSPWRTLLPAYWSPTFASDVGNGASLGAVTSGQDVVGRHSYVAQALVNLRNRDVSGSLDYEYSRFASPIIDAGVAQDWSYGGIYNAQGMRAGTLARRIRTYRLHVTGLRQRVRSFIAATVGAELEERMYTTAPAPLLGRLDPYYATTHRFPTLVVAADASNTQRPARSISPEDGVAAAASVRQRWESGAGDAGRSAVGVFAAYKSLDAGSFAHQVFALRLAGAGADRRTPSEYGIGGVSGSQIEVFPGLVVGDPSRTFPVRGFPTGAERGIQAYTASAEYRMPLALVDRGLGLLPLFLDRTSLTLFGDAGRATCPAGAVPACFAAPSPPTLASVGAEVDLDAALQYDTRYRLRLGVAHPISGAAFAGARPVSVFVTFGGTF